MVKIDKMFVWPVQQVTWEKLKKTITHTPEWFKKPTQLYILFNIACPYYLLVKVKNLGGGIIIIIIKKRRERRKQQQIF